MTVESVHILHVALAFRRADMLLQFTEDVHILLV